MKKGFTLIELVIVIAVIAILAGVLITTFSGVLKSAEDSVYLQTRKNSQTEDAIDEIFDTKVLSWNTIEEALVYAFVKTETRTGNISNEAMVNDIYTEISNLINDGYSCRVSKSSLSTMYDKTIENEFSDVQVLRLLKDSNIDNVDYNQLMSKLSPINNSIEKINLGLTNAEIDSVNLKLSYFTNGFSTEEKNTFITNFKNYISGNVGENINNISLSIDCDSSISFAEIKQISVNINNYTGTEQPIITSSDPDKVYVNANKIVGISDGSAIITATITIDNVKYSNSITVNSTNTDVSVVVINLDSGSKHTSLQDAITNVENDQTLLLIKDVSLNYSCIISIDGKSFTLIGNNSTNKRIISYSGDTNENYIFTLTNLSDLTIKDVIFDGNNNIGNIKADNNSKLSINNCIIQNGKVSENPNSGGIRINNSNLEIVDSKIKNNTAVVRGAGMFITNATGILINNCIISNNQSTTTSFIQAPHESSYNGGAGVMIFNDNPSLDGLTYNIIDTDFIENFSTTYGGGLYFRYITNSNETQQESLILNISNCKFIENSAQKGGGCSFVCDVPRALKINIDNTTVFNSNFASNVDYGGGAIFDNLAYIEVMGNTAFLNNVSNCGSALALRNTYSTKTNTQDFTYIKLICCSLKTDGDTSNMIFVFPNNEPKYPNNIVNKNNAPITNYSSNLVLK